MSEIMKVKVTIIGRISSLCIIGRLFPQRSRKKNPHFDDLLPCISEFRYVPILDRFLGRLLYVLCLCIQLSPESSRTTWKSNSPHQILENKVQPNQLRVHQHDELIPKTLNKHIPRKMQAGRTAQQTKVEN